MQPLAHMGSDLDQQRMPSLLSALDNNNDSSATNGHVVYRLSDVKVADENGNPYQTCGAKYPRDITSVSPSSIAIFAPNSTLSSTSTSTSTSVSQAGVNDVTDTLRETLVEAHGDDPVRAFMRKLLLKQWTSCYTGQAVRRRLTVGFVADVGFFRAMDSSEDVMRTKLALMVSASNDIYNAQLNIHLTLSALVVQTATGGPTWNDAPSTITSGSGCMDIETKLETFSAWRRAQYPSTHGIMHLMTNCYKSGTIGLAWIGTLCMAHHGTGVSSYTSQAWLTVAHEIGHNFNANHTFGKGGIMDYSDGKLLPSDPDNPGEYGFHSDNKDSVCAHVGKALAGTTGLPGGDVRIPAAQCFQTFNPICGDGVVEGTEECDEGADTACCVGCKLVNGAVCSSGECCNVATCTPKDSTIMCDNNRGYCGPKGQCTQATMCPQYKMVFCGVQNCKIRCIPSSTGVCTDMSTYRDSSTGQPLPQAVEDGSPCGGSSQCKRSSLSASTCTAVATYSWRTTLGTCTGTGVNTKCGAGTQAKTVVCASDSAPSVAVADSFCNTSTKPPTDPQSCTLAATCSYSWATGTYGACSATTCGASGTQARTAQCKVTASTGEVVDAADSVCTSNGVSKPPTSQSCTKSCYEWQVTLGTCTGTGVNTKCGAGTQTRTAFCANDLAPTVAVADSFCNTSTKPPTDPQSCTLAATCSYGWATGTYGACSAATCGAAGTQTRTAQCKVTASTGEVVDAADTVCTSNGVAKPPTSQSCTMSCYEWQVTLGTCTGTGVNTKCGAGTQTRTVICASTSAPTVSVAESNCTGVKPSTANQACTLAATCTYSWTTGTYGPCSATTCGAAGTQTRSAQCQVIASTGEVVDATDTVCTSNGVSKPVTSQSCTKACYEWQVTLGTCTGTGVNTKCGAGTQTRTVICASTSAPTVSVAESNCTGVKPSTANQACTLPATCSYSWLLSDFGACSATTCGTSGTQARTVKCQVKASTGEVVDASESVCVTNGAGSAPSSSQPCSKTCYDWQVTLSTCVGAINPKCGNGTQTRTVYCTNILTPATKVDDALCSSTTKPSTADQTCSVPSSCTFSWSMGEYSTCSGATCGSNGTQTRTVQCKAASSPTDFVIALDSVCVSNGAGTKPQESKTCTFSCHIWRTILADCEGTGVNKHCGPAQQNSFVYCADSSTYEPVSDSLCANAGAKPSSTPQSCSLLPCVYSWATGAWGSCNATCSTAGERTRTATCKVTAPDSLEVVTSADTDCTSNGSPKPAVREPCTATCYAWKTVTGQCVGAVNPKCGVGMRTDTVICADTSSPTVAVAESNCAGQVKPTPSSTSCTHSSTCTYSWVAGEYGTCSSLCGSGTQSRTLRCKVTAAATPADSVIVDNVDVCSSIQASKPATSQNCTTPCYDWQTKEISCVGSVNPACGTGTATRDVFCASSAAPTVSVSSSLCPTNTKPPTTAACTLPTTCSYAWDVTAYSACSVTCGTGTRTRNTTCQVVSAATPTTSAVKVNVADTVCTSNGVAKPVVSESCALATCKPYWSIGEWSACSGPCYSLKRTRDVTCSLSNGVTVSTVTDSTCTSGGAGDKPITAEACSIPATCPNWKTGEWTECSPLCKATSGSSDATRTRSLTCVIGGSSVSIDRCTAEAGPAPTVIETCSNTPVCRTYSYKCYPSNSQSSTAALCSSDSTWSPCSAQTCGTGTQTRNIVCVSDLGAEVTSALCAGVTVPATSRECVGVQGATCLTYAWQAGSVYGPCSVTACGLTGTETRAVSCVNTTLSSSPSTIPTEGAQIVSDTYCEASSKPSTSRACATNPCPVYEWSVSDFGPCVGSCGTGTRTREVVCKDSSKGVVVSSDLCVNSSTAGAAPASSQSCTLAPCQPMAVFWSAGDWSACSKTCDHGVRTRPVRCMVDGVVAAESQCLSPANAAIAGAKPAVVEACGITPCPGTWSIGSWGVCSKGCGGGTLTRSVTCTNSTTGQPITENLCLTVKPTPAMVCNTFSCPKWTTTAWSACGAASQVGCGVTTRTRTVTCVNATGHDVAYGNCPGSSPPSSEACSIGSCPYWEVGEWGACDTHCGKRFRFRKVACVVPANPVTGLPDYVDESPDKVNKCPSPAPVEYEACTSTTSCGGESTGYWSVAPWSACSATCGPNAMRTRQATCLDSATHTAVSESACPQSARPVTSEACDVPSTCDAVAYNYTTLSPCNVECGMGTQTRSAVCLYTPPVQPGGKIGSVLPRVAFPPASACGTAITSLPCSIPPSVCSQGGPSSGRCAANGKCECLSGYSGIGCSMSPTIDPNSVALSPSTAAAGSQTTLTWQYSGTPSAIYLFYIIEQGASIGMYLGETAASNAQFTFTIPAKLSPGQYTIRGYFNGGVTRDFPTLTIASPCSYVNCGQYGTCVEATATCACTNGWSGARCEITPCATLDCVAGSTDYCANTEFPAKCHCMEGFTGTRCSMEQTCQAANTSRLCLNGGSDVTCDECKCANKWITKANETDSNGRKVGCTDCPMTCNNGTPSADCARCVCKDGFYAQCKCKYLKARLILSSGFEERNLPLLVDSLTSELSRALRIDASKIYITTSLSASKRYVALIRIGSRNCEGRFDDGSQLADTPLLMSSSSSTASNNDMNIGYSSSPFTLFADEEPADTSNLEMAQTLTTLFTNQDSDLFKGQAAQFINVDYGLGLSDPNCVNNCPSSVGGGGVDVNPDGGGGSGGGSGGGGSGGKAKGILDEVWFIPVVAGAGGLIVLIAIACCCARRNKKNKKAGSSTSGALSKGSKKEDDEPAIEIQQMRSSAAFVSSPLSRLSQVQDTTKTPYAVSPPAAAASPSPPPPGGAPYILPGAPPVQPHRQQPHAPPPPPPPSGTSYLQSRPAPPPASAAASAPARQAAMPPPPSPGFRQVPPPVVAPRSVQPVYAAPPPAPPVPAPAPAPAPAPPPAPGRSSPASPSSAPPLPPPPPAYTAPPVHHAPPSPPPPAPVAPPLPPPPAYSTPSVPPRSHAAPALPALPGRAPPLPPMPSLPPALPPVSPSESRFSRPLPALPPKH